MEPERANGVVLVLDADTLGRGDDDLGSLLMANFLKTIASRAEVPSTIVCYNGGVRLAERGCDTAPLLAELAERGTDILLCGTCVNHLQIGERLGVGRVGNMAEIAEVLARAGKLLYS